MLQIGGKDRTAWRLPCRCAEVYSHDAKSAFNVG